MSQMMAMVYCCCVCNEDLSASAAASRAKKAEEDNQNGQNQTPTAPLVAKTKPLVTTKCGHLFHPQCLQKVFAQTENNNVWSSKSCPVCQTTLTVGTDLIRIFPTGITPPEVGPSVEELMEKLKKYEGQILELRNMLESSFLRNRDAENTASFLRNEVEATSKELKEHVKFKTEVEGRMESLSLENDQLRNTVISLSKNLARMDLNGLNLFPASPPGFIGNPPPQMVHQQPQHAMHYPRLPVAYQGQGQHQGQNLVHRHPPGMSGPNGPNPNANGGVGVLDEHFRSQANFPSLGMSSAQMAQLQGQGLNNFNEKLTLKKKLKGEKKKGNEGKILNDSVTEIPSAGNNNDDTDDSSSGIAEGENGDSSSNSSQFSNERKYWKYRCEKCNGAWGSYRNFGSQPQSCRMCHNLVYPYVQFPLIPKELRKSSPSTF